MVGEVLVEHRFNLASRDIASEALNDVVYAGQNPQPPQMGRALFRRGYKEAAEESGC